MKYRKISEAYSMSLSTLSNESSKTGSSKEYCRAVVGFYYHNMFLCAVHFGPESTNIIVEI